MKQSGVIHDEYRLKCISALNNKLRPIISEQKNLYMNAIKEKEPLTMKEFEQYCFAVTVLCDFERFLDLPWAFLEITKRNNYVLPIGELEMMVLNPEFYPIEKYLFLCEQEKSIIPLSDRLFVETLINAIDMVYYKKKYKSKGKNRKPVVM